MVTVLVHCKLLVHLIIIIIVMIIITIIVIITIIILLAKRVYNLVAREAREYRVVLAACKLGWVTYISREARAYHLKRAWS